jgi:hypothetical protein
MSHISTVSAWLLALSVAFHCELAHAAQSLLPAPYPEVQGGTAQIGGAAGAITGSRHQVLIPTPVPQTYGPEAAANPSPARVSRHQHLIKHPYWRQYHQFH